MTQHTPLKHLAGCEECDTVYRKKALQRHERAYCIQCGAELYRHTQPMSQLLPWVVSALIVFIIANAFPIVQVELQGNYTSTTVLGAAWAMFSTGRELVGALVLITTFIFPLLELLLLLYILLPIVLSQRKPRWFIHAMRLLMACRTWGMVEVFLIGILVTLVKLVSMVIVIPDIALWAFAILSLLMVYISSFKVKDLWYDIERSLN